MENTKNKTEVYAQFLDEFLIPLINGTLKPKNYKCTIYDDKRCCNKLIRDCNRCNYNHINKD